MKVVKRDGRIVDFDENKIISGITKAILSTKNIIEQEDLELAKKIALEISHTRRKKIQVEEIQDLIEKKLMSSNQKEVAKKYIIYRNDRNRVRQSKTKLMKEVADKLAAKNVENSNANLDERSFGGRLGAASEAVAKQDALDNCMSEMSRENHLNNEIYIHDLSSYSIGSHNCLSIPFDKLLKDGFNTRQTDIRGAKSVSSALQLVAVIFQVQSLVQFGGVASTHLDWTLVPFVRMSFTKHLGDGLYYIEKKSEYKVKRFKKWAENNSDGTIHFDDEEFKNKHPDVWEYAMDMTEREVKQSVEALYHNLNSLQSRSGNQLPFTSLNYGTCILPEGRLIIKSLLEGSLVGTGRLGKTSIFPCGIFKLKKGVNRKPGDPNYDLFQLALKSTAKRLYPNYANVDWSGNEGYDPNDPRTEFSTMGCRTANGWDINGLGQLKDGRGNICPVTIILPTLAMQAKGEVGNKDIDSFMSILDIKLHQAKDMLIERFEWICSQPMESAKFMYENGTMAGYVPEEGIRSALKHGTLAIGQIALAETLQILIGCDHTTQKGMELAKKIEQLFKDRCAEFKNEYKLNFGVYMTPAESLCYTALKKFRKEYGILPKISDHEFFTNSIHVPVWDKVDLFTKIDIESQLTGYSSAGCITYVEMDSNLDINLEALEKIVNYAMDKDIPYMAINVPNDTCNDCGYTSLIDDKCPNCGGTNISRLRRVTGYLTGDYKTAFNLGKQAEVEERVRHTGMEIE